MAALQRNDTRNIQMQENNSMQVGLSCKINCTWKY